MSDEPFSEQTRADAIELVRALSVAAGDEDRVVDVLERYAAVAGHDAAVKVALAAVVVTFGSCMTSPVSLQADRPVPVHIPMPGGA